MAEPLRLVPSDSEPTVSEHALTARLARGDQAAFDEVLRWHWPSVTLFAERALGDADAGHDVAQETFIRLWQHRSEIQQGLLRAFIFRTARNLVLDELRKRSVRRRWGAWLISATPSTPTPSALLDASETERAVAQAISALPTRRREAFTLAYLHDLSYKEVALVLGISAATVKNQVAAALAQLRIALASYQHN
jgi:RNA polymerase sigma factor (sigma-70 family)